MTSCCGALGASGLGLSNSSHVSGVGDAWAAVGESVGRGVQV